MNYSDLKSANPRLFWDGICRGSISYSQASALQTGSAAQFPLVEGILGGPKTPIATSFNPQATPPIGASNTYPKPWRSGGQFAQDASYGSSIGPFARLVKIPDTIYMDNTCIGDIPNCGGSSGGIYGRLGIGNGTYLGFRAQDWYNQNEGTYNTAYWNSSLNPAPNPEWLTWKKWWDSASKATIEVIWADPLLPFLVEVEVAYSTPQPGDASYYPATNLSAFDDYALPLLSVVISAAVIGGAWI